MGFLIKWPPSKQPLVYQSEISISKMAANTMFRVRSVGKTPRIWNISIFITSYNIWVSLQTGHLIVASWTSRNPLKVCVWGLAAYGGPSRLILRGITTACCVSGTGQLDEGIPTCLCLAWFTGLNKTGPKKGLRPGRRPTNDSSRNKMGKH